MLDMGCVIKGWLSESLVLPMLAGLGLVGEGDVARMTATLSFLCSLSERRREGRRD